MNTANKTCPFCGKETLTDASGDYCFKLPINRGGWDVVISDARWLECANCGEHTIPDKLGKDIERQAVKLTPGDLGDTN